MLRQAALTKGLAVTLTSLFRQLHLESSSHAVTSKVICDSLVWNHQLPKKDNSLRPVGMIEQGLSFVTLAFHKSHPLLTQARQEIVENPFQYTIRPSIGIPPEMIRRPEYRTPYTNITPLEIPSSQNISNKEIKDNPDSSSIIEKQAARLIVIRRTKMNKHKLRKLRKKMKYVWARVRLRRAIRKEKAYLNSKMDLINAARSFNAKEYVAGVIKKAKEEPLPRKWTDPLMPDWYRDQEMKKEAWQKRYQKMINLYVNKSITIDFRDKKK